MRILLTTDGSEYSQGAARFLTRLNLSPEDEITVLHVISEVSFKERESYYAIPRRHGDDHGKRYNIFLHGYA